MAADAFKMYHTAKEYGGDGSIDWDTNTFKIALFTSASNCATLTHDALADLTGQVAAGNGYTTGGVTLTSVTWTNTAGTVTFDAADPSWTASGGSITARFAVIYQSGLFNGVTDALVCFALLDNTPADVTVTAGNTLTIQFSASGIFDVSGGS